MGTAARPALASGVRWARDRVRVLRAGPGTRAGARGARRPPPRDRRARLPHPAARRRGGLRGAPRGRDALRPERGAARAARGGGGRAGAHARRPDRPRARARGHRRQAVPVLHRPRHLRARRRGRAPRPGLPDLRVRDPLGGRHAGAPAAARGLGLRLRRRRARRPAGTAHEARHPQLAAQPHRRRRRRRVPAAAAAELMLRTPAWVLSDEVYSRLLHDGGFASIASVPGMLERTVVLDALLEDLRDDRVALRVRRGPRGARRAADALLRELDVVRAAVRAARGRRRARRAPRTP